MQVRWLLLVFVMGVGCAHSSRTADQDLPGHELRRLDREELLIGGWMGSDAWITRHSALTLRYYPSRRDVSSQVQFYYRSKGDREWRLGPRWVPGEAAPRWQPPEEGRWELLALPVRSGGKAPRARGRAPQVDVVFDWTPPQLLIDEALPAHALQGGEDVPLAWRVEDRYLGVGPVTLETSEGRNSTWRKVAQLPNSGAFRWQAPNRPLAGVRLRLTVRDAAGNRTRAVVPGTLTVHGVAPRVTVPEWVGAKETRAQLPYELHLPRGSRVERVELWVSVDDGKSWRLAGYDHDRKPPFDIDLYEGRWGFWVVVEDAAGNRSAYPTPGDTPPGRLLIDMQPPSVEWGEPEVQRVDEQGADGLAKLEVRLPYRIHEPELAKDSLAASYLTETGSWVGIPGSYTQQGEILVRRPYHASEPLKVQITGRDRVGNGFAADTELFPRQIVSPPVASFTDAPSGWCRGGEKVLIGYRTEWESSTENPVELAYSLDGENWNPIAERLPPLGVYEWILPRVNSTDVRLRLTLRGTHGRSTQAWNLEPFSIDSLAPSAVLVGPTSGFGIKTRLLVDAKDSGGSGVHRLELYARRAGTRSWEVAGSGVAAAGNVVFQPFGAGNYELWLVAVDSAGNRSMEITEATREQLFLFTVEDAPAGIRLLSFQDGGVFAGGSRQLVFMEWTATDTSGWIDVEFSADDGGTWRAIRTVELGERRVMWQLPQQNLNKCRVRVIAKEVTGRRTTDQSQIPFAIDASPPVVKVVGVEGLADEITKIHYRTRDDGAAELHQVWLYYTLKERLDWKKWPAPFPAADFVTVQLPRGAYRFHLQGVDSVGNVSAAPERGRSRETVYRVGEERRTTLELLTPQSGVLAGGSRHYIFWHLDAAGIPFADRPVLLEYRIGADSRWQTLARGLPPVGKIPWLVPEGEGQLTL
ncbi:MAG: hypothetical protein V3T77_06485, partial [Planctomycetota bacterium]